MAGDWIVVESVTPDKPEVFQIAEVLEIDPDAVVGKCVRVWIWADQQTYDGNAGSVTKALLNRIAGVTGFADALENVGWLHDKDGRLTFPNFDRHNGSRAKTRALTRKRVSKHRNATSVTLALPEKRREEKRREDSKARAPFKRPSVEDVKAYCDSRSNQVDPEHFISHYTANGWRVGRNPMKDWKAAVRTWERNGIRNAGKNGETQGILKPIYPEDE